MEFITQGNRIAVENFDKGKLYTVLWKNDTQENLMCISIGADCVVFQGEAPINLFTLSMRNADSIDSIEPTQLGTTNYNNLINKPQINGVDLIGNKTGAQLGLASQSDLEDYATNASVVSGLATKQDALSSSQLAAVNSGITSELVTQIGTNTSAIAGKQDALSSSQLAAVNSGITSEDVEQISTNKNNISSCQAFTNNATIDSNRNLYISVTEPTGDIPIGSTWINGKEIKAYSRTDNLSDGIFTQGGVNDDGSLSTSSKYVRIYVPVTAGKTYSFGSNKYIITIYGYSGDWSYAENRVELILFTVPSNTTYTFTAPSGVSGVGIALCNAMASGDIVPSDVTNFMFNEGSSLLPYEPYLEWK